MAENNTTDASPNPPARKYVTRACDACKKRKSKCDGYEPCSRCQNSELECTFNSSYNRVQRRFNPLSRSQAKASSKSSSTPSLSKKPSEQNDQSTNHEITNIDRSSDPSVHAFLKQVSGHLTRIGRGLPRNLFKQEQDALGGSSDDIQAVFLPDKTTAKEYVQCYFEHGNVTYRYIARNEILEILEQVYGEDDSILQNHTKMAIILLVMGIGCIWFSSWKNKPLLPFKKKAWRFLQAAQLRLDKLQQIFPPTIGLLQAHVLKCQLELYSSRFNSAWMTLGLAVRLGQVIEIQKESDSSDTLESHYRRSIFWAMFVIDRYLAVNLGRPMAINEQDVTIAFPLELEKPVLALFGTQEAKIATGAVAHARLTKILGHAIARLYPVTRRTSTPTERIMTELEEELEQWLQDTPVFFHPQKEAPLAPNDDFYDVPWTFRRQQKTIRSAFYFVNMIIYRGHLLQEFLQEAPNTPRSGSSSSIQVRKCVDNALAMARLAADAMAEKYPYSPTFWTTSHFIFCAISILLVYLTLYQDSEDRATIEEVVQEAMKVHRKLDTSANMNTQKLLEESHFVAQNLHEASSTISHSQDTPEQTALFSVPRRQVPYEETHTAVQNDSAAQNTISHSEAQWTQLNLQQGNNPAANPYSVEEFDISSLDMIMDIGFDSTMLHSTCGFDNVQF